MIGRAWDWLFSTDALMPHGFCLLWRADLVWAHVISDAVIALSYYTIPVFLVILARRRSDLLYHWPFFMFGIFIMLCGTTHVMSIVAFWVPIYGLEAVVKAATAIASIATAIAVWPLLPRLLSLPSRDALAKSNAELERRVAERTEELERANGQLKVLLQEVHHRVKNNLQVIVSMLRLQKRHFDDAQFKEALDRITGRIHAMSLVHEALYNRASYVAIGAGDYLRQFVDYLRRADPRAAQVKIELQVDSTALSIDQAVALALIANEVITNALKHGFPDSRPGRIDVTLRSTGGRTRLEIADNGVGMGGDRPAATVGFGLQIVQALARQLEGTAEFRPEPAGTRFVLDFTRDAGAPASAMEQAQPAGPLVPSPAAG